jgi:hypothetical protein
MKKYLRFGLFVFFLFVSAGVFAQTSRGANFGNFPADYHLAYEELFEFSKPLTPRTLFGLNAPYAAFLDDVPVVVTMESSSGTREKFSAELLMTAKEKNLKAMRLEVIFEPNNAERECVPRYIKMTNLINGTVYEKKSNGDLKADVENLGMFSEAMEIFWDVSKYR